jgi:hypothetical protein
MTRSNTKSTLEPLETTASGAAVIDRGDDWSLLVRDGDVMAVRQIPHDGQEYRSTENRRNRADKRSQYQLAMDDVVAHYARVEHDADPVAFATLHQRVQEIRA